MATRQYVDEMAQKYLPLAGGTMYGSIRRNLFGSYVSGVKDGALIQNTNEGAFGAIFAAFTQNYKVGLGTHSAAHDDVILFSITKENVDNNVNDVQRRLLWNAGTGTLVADTFTGEVAGNAASATKLQTSRKINGVNFDGTQDITITAQANGGTSATCSGNAASATKLQTGRAISVNLASSTAQIFDGTNNIVTCAVGVLPVEKGGTGNTVGAMPLPDLNAAGLGKLVTWSSVNSYTLPPGGTWFIPLAIYHELGGQYCQFARTGLYAGGTTIASGGESKLVAGCAIRIA